MVAVEMDHDVIIDLGGSLGELAIDPLKVIMVDGMGKEKGVSRVFERRDDGNRGRGLRVLEQQLLGKVLSMPRYANRGRGGEDSEASQKVD